MKKKAIAIYLIGVILAWLVGYNHMSNFKKTLNQKYSQMTYGDVAFVTSLSVLSWPTVVAFGILELTAAEFWGKPI